MAAEKAAPDRRARREAAARLRRESDPLVAAMSARQASPTVVRDCVREEPLTALMVERGRLAVAMAPGGRDIERMCAVVLA